MITDERVEQYCYERTSPECSLLLELIQDTRTNMTGAQMLSDRLVGQLLKTLIRLSGAKRVLEIGTFTGYSALMMAQELPADGELVTLEKSTEAVTFAKRYFARSDHGHKIKTVIGEALPELDKRLAAHEQFDFIFVDADKTNYSHYFEKGIELLRSGGAMVFDNMLWHGEVVSPQSKQARCIAELNDKILQDKRVENVILPVRDGVNVVWKR